MVLFTHLSTLNVPAVMSLEITDHRKSHSSLFSYPRRTYNSPVFLTEVDISDTTLDHKICHNFLLAVIFTRAFVSSSEMGSRIEFGVSGFANSRDILNADIVSVR